MVSKVTPAQMRKIYALSRERNLDSDMLHSHIFALTGKDSIKELSISEAIKIIDSLEGHKTNTPGMMTERQLKLIKGLAKDIGWTDEKGRVDMDRLSGFITERFNIAHINWVNSRTAGQIIEALKAMKNRKKKEETV